MSDASNHVCPVGLDPPTLFTISSLLYRLAKKCSPRVVLALRPQDSLPEWITHVIYLDSDTSVAYQGPKKGAPGEFFRRDRTAPLLCPDYEPAPKVETSGMKKEVVEGQPEQSPVVEVALENREAWERNETLVDMKGVEVKYGEKQILGAWQQDVQGQPKNGLWWTVRRGERWGIFGPNGRSSFLTTCNTH